MSNRPLPRQAWWETTQCPSLHHPKHYELLVIGHPQHTERLYGYFIRCKLCGWSRMTALQED